MSRDSLPWNEKYNLKRIDDSKIHLEQISQLKEYIANYSKIKKLKKKAVLIHGVTGIGKTTLVYALANSLGLEVIEMNASDYRDKKSIDDKIGLASKQKSLFFSGKIILIDEIDNTSGMKDRGAIAEISRVVEESAFPVIMTAIDPWDSKLSPIRKISQLIELKDVSYIQISEIFRSICDSENIEYDDYCINTLARRCGSDIRAGINDLQTLVSSGKLNKENIEDLYDRNKSQTMPRVLQIIFKSKDYNLLKDAFNDVDSNFDEIVLWLEENLPNEYKNPEDLYTAFDYISKSDIFAGRIRRRQHWRFLVYIFSFLGVGVGLSKKEKNTSFITYKPTSRILKMWITNRKNMKRKALSEKISVRNHISKKEAFRDYKFYKQFSKKKEFMESMVEDFELDKDDIASLKK
jgi:replication factor C large subunit